MTDTGVISAEQMRLVLEISRQLTVTADLDALLTHIAEAATSLLYTERASIFLHDPETDELWTKVALGAKEIRVPSSAGIVGHVFRTNELLEVADPYGDSRFNREIDRRSGFVTRNLLTVPLKDINGMALGVLQAVNRIGGGFTGGDRALVELLADQAGVAIQRFRLQQEVVRSAGLRHEMDLAQKVQAAMIPQQAPRVRNLKAAGWMRPASVTGGDCYDLWEMPDGRMGIFVGDASGHGIAPAIVVSQARTLVRSLSELDRNPSQVLERVNARLASDLEAGRFVTAFLGCMSSGGVLEWCSAGHGPIFFRRHGEAAFETLEPLGPPVGVLEAVTFDAAAAIEFEAGGMLVVMSDGVFEARSQGNELMEVERVIGVLDGCQRTSPGEMLGRLRQSIREWQGREEPVDDQTAVIVEYSPEGG